MFQENPQLTFVQIAPDTISALYQSVNTATVVLSGQPPALASAVIVGHRIASRRYGVVLALHLSEARKHLIFTHQDGGLDPAGAREAAEEAIGFVESMGFMMENAGWKDLDPVAQRERLAALKVFQPPEGSAEEGPKVLDPRTKLARLLVQF
jgi:hypothetical protein